MDTHWRPIWRKGDEMKELQYGDTIEYRASEIAKLNNMFGEDCREHPEWNEPDLSYIDVEFNDDFSGIKHDGAEKTYFFDKIINLIIREMKNDFPDFMLEGELLCQGEDIDDRWLLKIIEGKAVVENIIIDGEKVTCPHCGGHFILETASHGELKK